MHLKDDRWPQCKYYVDNRIEEYFHTILVRICSELIKPFVFESKKLCKYLREVINLVEKDAEKQHSVLTRHASETLDHFLFVLFVVVVAIELGQVDLEVLQQLRGLDMLR